jgi:hypothetical protein
MIGERRAVLCISHMLEQYEYFPNPGYCILGHHQSTNVPTAGAQAFLMDYT